MRLHKAFAALLPLGIAACGSEASRDPVGPTSLGTATTYRAASATRTVSIRGTVETSETDIYQPETNTLLVHMTGTGVASHLGRFTLVDDGVASLTTGVGTGNVTYTAADGSAITGTASGAAAIVGDIAEIADTITITGGTGRFAGAVGVLTANRRLDLNTLLSSGSFDGTINLPK